MVSSIQYCQQTFYSIEGIRFSMHTGQIKCESMDKVFVTGADGMLGNSIVRELLIQHYQVKCLVQKGRNNGTLNGLEIELIEGDLTEPEVWKHEVKDCNIMINAAACTTVNPSRNALCYEINYKAVVSLVDICTGYNIKRFIQVGTATSFPVGTKLNPGKEAGEYSMAKFKMDYMDTKYLAQEYLLDAYVQKGFPVVLINPTYMIGQYDSLPSSGRLIIAITKKRLPGYTTGGKSFVHSKDVAVAIVNAIRLGETGQCYIAGGENLSYKEFILKVCSVNHVISRYKKIPWPIALILGFFYSVITRLNGKTPKLNYSMARVALVSQYYSSDKAISTLNMPQTKIEIAIKESSEWLRENNLL
jgi:dihydroflavonol-4-reductase